jgi:hypothetical protein
MVSRHALHPRHTALRHARMLPIVPAGRASSLSVLRPLPHLLGAEYPKPGLQVSFTRWAFASLRKRAEPVPKPDHDKSACQSLTKDHNPRQEVV